MAASAAAGVVVAAVVVHETLRTISNKMNKIREKKNNDFPHRPMFARSPLL